MASDGPFQESQRLAKPYATKETGPAAAKSRERYYEGSETTAGPAAQLPVVAQAKPSAASAIRPAARIPRNNAAAAVLLDSYRAIVVGGKIELSTQWVRQLTTYARSGGTVVLNSAQLKGLPLELLGVRLTGTTAEAHNARCLSPGEVEQNLKGQIFRYDRLELKGAQPLITTLNGEPLVTVNKVGKGNIVVSSLPNLLGEDERLTPFAAHLLAHVFADATPIQVSGDVEYLVNRNNRGWVITLINNNGVFKPQQGLSQVDRTAVVTPIISLRGANIVRAQEWLSEKPLVIKKQAGAADSVSVSIAPGGIAIVEIQ